MTVDFGASTLVDASVALREGLTALDALEEVAKVTTAYGGGFVQSVEGVGGPRESLTDWFYSVNGVLSKRGSGGLVVGDGDVTHWDYRHWGFRRNVSATLGCFPAFFVHGYDSAVRPTVVACGRGFEAEAEGIAALLRSHGAEDVDSRHLSELDARIVGDVNLIIVAEADEPLAREVFGEWEKLGLFARLETAGLEVFTSTGEATWVDGSVGLLQPLQNPWNPSGTGACENVALLVTGTDATGVRVAATALVEQHGSMTAWCGGVVAGSALSPLPERTG